MTASQLDVVTWGETMVRLSPPENFSLENAHSLEVWIGGTESNVAIALARLGLATGWASRLPENPLGRRIHSEVRRHGVDTSRVIWADGGQAKPERAGLIFLETGAAPRPTLAHYDRAASTIANLEAGELDTAYLSSARVLHLTGITPALGAGCREAWLASAQEAKAAGAKVSLDINYRAKLWAPGEAKETLESIFPHVDIVLGALRDVQLLFGMPEDAALAAESFAAAYHLPLAVLTLGAEGALAWDGKSTIRQKATATEVRDRIGAGDAFAAGFLFGWLEEGVARGLRCGTALAALQQTYRGDVSWATLADLLELVDGDPAHPRQVRR